jgi:predicted transcriptional regulator
MLDRVIRNPVMKTITVKADARFDSTLTELAKHLKTTKSGVIRAAVLNYKDHIEREALRQRVRDASAKTRQQARQGAVDFDAASADGI